MFYVPVILIGLVYKKDENCHPKLFVEKLIYLFIYLFIYFFEKFQFLGVWKFLLR